MISKLVVMSLLFTTSLSSTFAQNSKYSEKPILRTSALKINVEDMDKALSFYGDKLGFEIADRSGYPQEVVLKTSDNFKLILAKVKKLRKTEDTDTRVGMTLQVNDLNQAIEKMKSLEVEFAEKQPRKEGVGNAIYIVDPFGRKISLMHETIVKNDPFKEPKVYNFGLYVSDMNAGREFYENKLGFIARSERYLPLDMPLGHQDKTFAFMLHYRDWVKPIKSEYPKTAPFYTIVFETNDLAQATKMMKQNNIKIITAKKGKPIVFEDPFGNISELVESVKVSLNSQKTTSTDDTVMSASV